MVRYWSLLLDSLLWGRRPIGYHLTNLLLHAGTTAAVYFYLRRLLGHVREGAARGGKSVSAAWKRWAPLLAALLFASHPMLTETVAGVTHRKELLAAGFLVLALHRSLAPDRGLRASLSTALFFALAVFAKAPAVVFFPLVLAQDLWVRGRRPVAWLRRDVLYYVPAALAALGYLAYRRTGIEAALAAHPRFFEAYNPQAEGLSTFDRILTGLKTLHLYWTLLLAPFHPTLERHVEPVRSGTEALPWLVLATAAAGLLVASRAGRRRPALALGLAWLVIAPVPTLNFIPLNFLFSERYLYLPAIGLALAAAGLLSLLPERFLRPAAVVTGALVLAFGFTVVRHNRVWKNPATLLAATYRANPDSPRVLRFMAQDLLDRGRAREALPLILRSTEKVPESPDGWYLAARVHDALGETEAALDAYRNALGRARHPRATWSNDYGVSLLRAGRTEEALPRFADAVRLRPNHPPFMVNYAQALLLRPASRDSARHYMEGALARRPDTPALWMLLAESRLGARDSLAAAETARRGRDAVGEAAARAYLKGLEAEARGRPERAAALYRRLAADPSLAASLGGRLGKAISRVRIGSSPHR